MDGDALPRLALRELGAASVARVEDQRPAREPQRANHPQLDVGARGKPERLPLDEQAEGRLGGAGEQRRQSENPKHRRYLSKSGLSLRH